MADTSVQPGGSGGVASHRPPRGLPHGAPGASMASSAGGGAGCCPRGTVWSGCSRPTGCHSVPACKIRDPCREGLVEKHLTQNRVLGAVHSADQSPRPRSALPYINLYINGYGPPWTS